MAAILGSQFMMYIELNGQPEVVCYATDVQINRTYDTKEISGPQGPDRYFLYDMRSYTLQIPLLVVFNTIFNYLDFANAGENRLILNWSASTSPVGGIRFSGQALLTELDLTSQMRDIIKSDVSLIGSGPLVTEKLPISIVVYLSDFDKIRLVGCPDPYPITVFWYDGSMIGPADNADDVINIFNAYSATHGNLYTLTSSVDGGCNFNMDISYEADEPYPTTIFAQPGALFAISSDQINDFVISPDQNNDQGLTPIG